MSSEVGMMGFMSGPKQQLSDVPPSIVPLAAEVLPKQQLSDVPPTKMSQTDAISWASTRQQAALVAQSTNFVAKSGGAGPSRLYVAPSSAPPQQVIEARDISLRRTGVSPSRLPSYSTTLNTNASTQVASGVCFSTAVNPSTQVPYLSASLTPTTTGQMMPPSPCSIGEQGVRPTTEKMHVSRPTGALQRPTTKSALNLS